ncbi:MAG: TonB-dependent receptor plug domain-containing protein [Candidatus Lustribacter sp.]
MLSFFAAVIIAAASPQPSPAPCPSASPRATVQGAAAAATPCPAAAADLSEIGRVEATGRETNLVGTATAASEGTINQTEIANQPILRPGEILEDIPGLIISQHSGEGKANQYYLRGFQLDHGTDVAGTIDDIPVNMPSHAHGQGYSDINWLMPELVSDVTYKKGPYYADEGDFSTAGSYDLFYRNTIDPTLSLGAGDYGYDRIFLAASPQAGAGNLLYALELYHDNGTLLKPDEYKKINGVLRWSHTTDNSAFSVTAQAYRGDFDSTDQIPERLVEAGVIPFNGYYDPTDGGRTYRYTLSTSWEHDDPHGATRITAFGESYGLDLFSDFTYQFDGATDYYNESANPVTCNVLYSTCVPGPQHVTTYTSYCPANDTPTGSATAPQSVTPAPYGYTCSGQREQEDKRFVSGFKVARSLVGGNANTTIAAGMRNDNIYVLGLYLTNGQYRYPNGTLSNDQVVERDFYSYVNTDYTAGKLRLNGGLREDAYFMNVDDFQPANSGMRTDAMVNPKFTAAYALSPNQEFYLDFGDSFHSNDARGTTQTLDPQTHATVDPSGAAVVQYSPLVRAWGEEFGYRYSVPKLTTTVSFWKLNIASELVFDGDNGVTTPNGPTLRKGIELTNYYRPIAGLTLDADVATATARFLTNPDNLGTYVPESLNVVTAAGATWDQRTSAFTLRYEYFGPRTLNQSGSAISAPTGIVNAQISLKRPNNHRLNLDILNLLNAQGDDVEYYYGSWAAQDAKNPAYANNPTINPLLGGSGVQDYTFHPAQGRIVRLTYVLPLSF